MSNEALGTAPDASTDAAPAPVLREEPLSPGAMLRQAREKSGLHIAALAVSMKVPVKKLEALEADRLDLLPDAVFVRALASAMCRALKIDAAPILEKLPQTQVPRLDTELRAINTPFRSPAEAARPLSLPAFVRQPAALAVLGLLVAAVAVMFWPQASEPPAPVSEAPALMPPPAAQPSEPETIPAAQAPAGAAAVASQPAAWVAPAAPVLDAPRPATLAEASPVVASAATVTPVATPPAAADANSGKPPGAAPGTGVVVFRAKGTSWISVRDAQGVLQLRRTLLAGESAEAGGALPLSVTVGKADVTVVEVRGKVFNLTDVSKDNVARFEVK